ncbi:hypothetical protein [Fonticella tunisiensis]|uniref:hypothetical protein n=1 Tax=Fonticella tunisiensis TaxID=1096341 RepID=UPI00311AAB15
MDLGILLEKNETALSESIIMPIIINRYIISKSLKESIKETIRDSRVKSLPKALKSIIVPSVTKIIFMINVTAKKGAKYLNPSFISFECPHVMKTTKKYINMPVKINGLSQEKIIIMSIMLVKANVRT